MNTVRLRAWIRATIVFCGSSIFSSLLVGNALALDYTEPEYYSVSYPGYPGSRSSSPDGACKEFGTWTANWNDSEQFRDPVTQEIYTVSTQFWSTFGVSVGSDAVQYLCDSWSSIFKNGVWQGDNGGPPGNRWAVVGTCPVGYAALDAARCYRDSAEPDDDNNLGDPDYCPVGNPISHANGNKVETAQDYESTANGFPLSFQRTYNSNGVYKYGGTNHVGIGWLHNYARSISVFEHTQFVDCNRDGSCPTEVLVITNATVRRPDGRAWSLQRLGISSSWIIPAGFVGTFSEIKNASGVRTGWKYVSTEDETETYNALGQLISITNRSGFTQTIIRDSYGRIASVTDPFGRKLQFSYDSRSNIASITDPAGGIFGYQYDSSNNLIGVTNPDGTTKQYIYDDVRFTYALTGVVDAYGVRYATWTYDAYGRATSSVHAGGADLTTISYGSPITVTDAFGKTHAYNFSVINGRHKLGSISETCSTCAVATQYTGYDQNGYVSDVTDFNGNATSYTHDARGLETSRTYPNGMVVTTQWHSQWRLPLLISEFPIRVGDTGRTISFVYDAAARLTKRTETDTSTGRTRGWTYTYNALGLISAIDGPRIDVNDSVSIAYDAQGNIQSITNAAGHVTSFTAYDLHGHPLSSVGPNGLVTSFQYDARGRLIRRSAGSEVMNYEYNANGDASRITFANGSFLSYVYDGAHRLTRISDQSGNHVDYTLDALGNRIREDRYDSSSVLMKTHSRVFADVKKIIQDVGAYNQTSSYKYDANGNRAGMTDPLGNTASFYYDEMNRIAGIDDRLRGFTNVAYNSRGDVTQVIDPQGLSSVFDYDAFSSAKSSMISDRGSQTQQTDAAGNITQQTDARGMLVTYVYDALNRVTKATYSDGKVDTFVYDSGANGKGRLAKITDESGSTDYTYDAQGRVTKVVQTSKTTTSTNRVFTTSYLYDAAGRMTQVTYPSGMKVGYEHTNHLVTRVTLNGSTLISGIIYTPDDRVESWSWGNGATFTRSFNLDGYITSQSFGTGTRTLGYDVAGRVASIVDPFQNMTFTYDALGRLTRSSGTYPRTYEYDANGNRTTQIAGSTTTTYDIDYSSNRLNGYTAGTTTRSYSYDAAGNTLADGLHTYAYDAKGRMRGIDSNATTFMYNARYQRIRKLKGTTLTFFVYNAAGYLAGEYNGSGAYTQETIYLGNMPIGVWRAGVAYYIYSDHLNTSRIITNTSNTVVWRWNSEPFGNVTPTNTNFTYNLRFPGQYYDAESGLNYNFFRYYDQKTGRYVTSDPIGLAGGSNTYAYVRNNPLSFVDPLGLCPMCAPLIPPAIEALGYAAVNVAGGLGLAAGWDLMFNKPKPGSKPKGCPPKTIPIDEYPGLDKDDIHGIKDGVHAGPQDWTGIAPNGDVITGDSNGDAVNNGPKDIFLP